MPNAGKLIVFEGPDGVGKSTLVESSVKLLSTSGIALEAISFPGKSPGTLGWVVDQIHHKQQTFELAGLSDLSLQALHIAAHLDHIESRIQPILRKGAWVVLDRFWWSTWVYGHAANLDVEVLEKLIEAEKIAWKSTLPSVAFLINRTTPFRPEHTQERYSRLSALYSEIATRESNVYPVEIISNDRLEDSLQLIQKKLDELI